jgi:bifunctional N-acetylglucosamine-1-phosphate-uridyltransferase/glucosamine-1-phosphate-acetyltransferase GlmU-like protein
VLSPVNDKAMIDHLFERYRGAVHRFVIVVHPSFESSVREHVSRSAPTLLVDYVTQAAATGMLDAILLAADAVGRTAPNRIWITWCDQIGTHPDTVATLGRLSEAHPETHAILPTTRQSPPYIHLERDSRGRIIGIRQRREENLMPTVGESDMGLFSLSAESYFTHLPEFGREATASPVTGERNFLPFLPWLVRQGFSVRTFPSTNETEAIGVNTPDDRRRLEEYLRELDKA